MADSAASAQHPDPAPQPQLLLGLPPLAVHVLLSALSKAGKAAMLRTCKEARAAVLQHEPHLRFTLDGTTTSKQGAGALVEVLRTRTDPLDLELRIRGACDESCCSMMAQLARLPRSCVRNLHLRLPATDDSQDVQPVSWLGMLGAAFRSMKGLRIDVPPVSAYRRTAGHGMAISSLLFAGLSGCPLTHLTISLPSLQLDRDVHMCPQLLARWLPNITHLECSSTFGAQSLLRGLGPQLTSLVMNSTSLPDQTFTNTLATCRQLRSLKLPDVCQVVLDAAASLPLLTHVQFNTLYRIAAEQAVQPAWQEVSLKHSHVDELMRLPLGRTQRLVLHDASLTVKVPASADGVRELQAALAFIGRVPQLQHTGRDFYLNVNLPGTSQQGPQDPVAALNRLTATMAALAPIAPRAQHPTHVNIDMDAPCADLGSEFIRAVSAASGPSLNHLSVTMAPVQHGEDGAPETVGSVSGHFWDTLALQAPRLGCLTVTLGRPDLSQESATALARLMAAWRGNGLIITLQSDNANAWGELTDLKRRVQSLCDDMDANGGPSSVTLSVVCNGVGIDESEEIEIDWEELAAELGRDLDENMDENE